MCLVCLLLLNNAAKKHSSISFSQGTTPARPNYYFASSGGAKDCDQPVYTSVCLSVCPLTHLKNHTSEFHQMFSTTESI